MSILLHGLRLSNFRGIGTPPVTLRPFLRFNFFIGANNAGKSTVLDFIHRYLPHASKGSSQPNHALSYLDLHRGAAPEARGFAIGERPDVVVEKVVKAFENVRQFNPGDIELLKIVANGIAIEGYLWVEFDHANKRKRRVLSDYSVLLNLSQWQRLFGIITGQSGGGTNDWVSAIVTRLIDQIEDEFPKIQLIPAIREISDKSKAFQDSSGQGLINKLDELSRPDLPNRERDRILWLKINAFLKFVTSTDDASLEIPHNREHILVNMNGKVLPISSLGTGIQEVIMIGAFCTMYTDTIICIEEPELHLHPILQRRLMSYLASSTNNQYFIATHSPSFIDTPNAAVFHVFQQDGKTNISESILRTHRYNLCNDLGIKASDIVQANCVIWVEGPSDRIYLQKWLSQINVTFVEGIHYSVMYYGGRLLNHLSTEMVNDFIGLRTLNRHSAILIDSDRKNAKDPLNETKARIVKEFSDEHGYVWVTAGREIENYIDPARLHEAIRDIYGSSYESPLGVGPYDHALYFLRQSPKTRRKTKTTPAPSVEVELTEKNVDKIAVARKLCERELGTNVLDLLERLVKLNQFIQNAND